MTPYSSQKLGQALGSIGRRKNKVSVSVILRDMAARFPKALVANEKGLEVQLYPSSISPWNLSRYTPEPEDSHFEPGTLLGEIATKHGETFGYPNHFFLRGAQGLSTTDNYELSFDMDSPDLEEVRQRAQIIAQGPMSLIADPQWYSDAKVMGIGPFVFENSLTKSEGGFRLEKVLQITQDFMRFNQREKFKWFGIENYGDIRGRFFGFDKENAKWSGKGRYGWSGNSGEPSNQLWIQYLRKPNQQTFRDSEALARHTMDQQTVHFSTSLGEEGTELDGRNLFSSVGSIHRHGFQAWSGYAGNDDYSHVAGIETYYYLTGDQRAKEVLYEQAQFINRQTDDESGLRNGLDVIDRAAAVFYDKPDLAKKFQEKATSFLNFMSADHNGFGYNANETRLIDLNNDGVHDRDQGLSNRAIYRRSFEYFVRSAPGILYRHERTGDSNLAELIFDAVNILTVGDPKNPIGDGDDWDLGVDGHASGLFYHVNSLSYAANIAENYGKDPFPYYALAKLCIENHTHGGNDINHTSPISLNTLKNLPVDWTKWQWKWQQDDDFDPNNPGLLWLHRMVMYENEFMQDYHSYRAFADLATGAAMVRSDDSIDPK